MRTKLLLPKKFWLCARNVHFKKWMSCCISSFLVLIYKGQTIVSQLNFREGKWLLMAETNTLKSTNLEESPCFLNIALPLLYNTFNKSEEQERSRTWQYLISRSFIQVFLASKMRCLGISYIYHLTQWLESLWME